MVCQLTVMESSKPPTLVGWLLIDKSFHLISQLYHKLTEYASKGSTHNFRTFSPKVSDFTTWCCLRQCYFVVLNRYHTVPTNRTVE